jgi:hypothetical protein
MNSETHREGTFHRATTIDPEGAAPVDEPFLRPDWVPASGHALRLAGVHFDAVRIRGHRGEEIMAALLNRQGWAAGPIVHMATTNEVTFLLPTGGAAEHQWPVTPQLQTLTAADNEGTYVGIPALTGATWPLLWRSIPTVRAPFVNAAVLHDTIVRGLEDELSLPEAAVAHSWGH